MAQLSFNVLEFFKEEINHEDAIIKIAAMSKLELIAFALGPSKTLNELIPYLRATVLEEPFASDEEFLCITAKMLQKLAKYVDGEAEALLSILEHLAAQEETVIRAEAIESLCSIVSESPALVPKYLVPILHRLASSSHFFTARVSACALFPVAYRWCSGNQKDGLRKAFVTICTDDTPMVRRAAASKLREMVEVCDKRDFLADLLGVYRGFAREDTQDVIRVSCLQATLALVGILDAQENHQYTIQVILDAAADRSWRVRFFIAQNLDSFHAAFGAEILFPCWEAFLKDQEQEVRKVAVSIIEKTSLTDDQLLNHFVSPFFPALALDSSPPVRAALAKTLGPISKTLGRDLTQRHVLPIISTLMQDEFHEVRLNMVSHAGTLFEVLDSHADGMNSALFHAIQSLALDNNWRVRQRVVEQIPKLGALFGAELFQTKFDRLYLPRFEDSVHAVRKTAIGCISEICDSFGPVWSNDHFLPKVLDSYSQSSGYANRVTVLLALKELAKSLSEETISQRVLPCLLKALRDSVPNVRFVACDVIASLMERVKQQEDFSQKIRPVLIELMQDSDVDVVYFASKGLAGL